MESNDMDFAGKKILITGADGFIGSHLTEMVFAKGGDVRALAQYNSFNNWGWLEKIPCQNNIEIVCGDVRDSNFCRKISKGMDIVFNLAALIAIPYSYVAPDSYVDTNIKGALNICQAARDESVQRVIQISTSEVYGTAKYVPIDENHPLQPQSPYSASKIGADAISMSFYNAFGLPVVIARPFNTYGPRQSARAIIPTVITQIASGIKKIKIGDGHPTRDFSYVGDTCEGLCQLGLCDAAIGQTVNIGSNYEISIFKLVEKIKELMKTDIEIVSESERLRPENSEVLRLWCDNTKIGQLTGFTPSYNLDQGLLKTIEWFTKPENLQQYKAEIFNV
jgi:NAD dependent epimerase/dehydratase